MAPNMFPWSVSAIAGMPASTAALMTSSSRLAPSRRLNWLWRWRWTKSDIGVIAPDPMLSEPGMGWERGDIRNSLPDGPRPPKTLITPALFSRPPRPSPREKRENSQITLIIQRSSPIAPPPLWRGESKAGMPQGYPSPGAAGGAVGRGAGVRVLGGGALRRYRGQVMVVRAPAAAQVPSVRARFGRRSMRSNV